MQVIVSNSFIGLMSFEFLQACLTTRVFWLLCWKKLHHSRFILR